MKLIIDAALVARGLLKPDFFNVKPGLLQHFFHSSGGMIIKNTGDTLAEPIFHFAIISDGTFHEAQGERAIARESISPMFETDGEIAFRHMQQGEHRPDAIYRLRQRCSQIEIIESALGRPLRRLVQHGLSAINADRRQVLLREGRQIEARPAADIGNDTSFHKLQKPFPLPRAPGRIILADGGIELRAVLVGQPLVHGNVLSPFPKS